MASGKRWSGLVIGILAMMALAGAAEAKVDVDGNLLAASYRYYFVNGDEGRFREDRYAPNLHTGGIERFALAGKSDGIVYDVTLRALHEYNYDLGFSFEKEGVAYLKFEGDQFRKFYDGSNEAWDPGVYNLPAEFADWADEDIYADRTDFTLESGISLPFGPQLTLAWDRWSRRGMETLLRGERAQRTGVTPNLRRIPALAWLDGVSNTYSAEFAQTFAKKYEWTLRTEWEEYHDDQYIYFPRYLNGALEEARTFQDYPEFRDSRTYLTFNSFVREDIHLSANYLHTNLNNQTERSELRPNVVNSFPFIEPDVNNRRRSDAATLGADFLKLSDDLQASVNARYENARTRTNGRGLTGTTERLAESQLDERWYAEDLSLTYKGIPRTLVSLAANWEQRRLDWRENEDVRGHEIVTNFGFPNTNIVRESDIDFNDAVYTVTAINRPFEPLKLTVRYRRSNRERDYTERADNSAAFYPGYLGDQDRDVNEWTAKGDWRFHSLWTASFEYQRQDDDISFERQTSAGQQMTMDRFSLNLLGNPLPKLTLVASAMQEQYDLLTPTDVVPGSDWEDGTTIYDYSADLWLYSLTGSYLINPGSSASVTYQRTEVDGTIRNFQNEVWAGYRVLLFDAQTLELRYEFFDFNDQSGNGFDDYDGHGVYVGYEFAF